MEHREHREHPIHREHPVRRGASSGFHDGSRKTQT